MAAPGLAIFPDTLVVAEAGSRLTLIEEHFSEEAAEITFSNALTEIHAGEGASVRYVYIQRWGGHVHNLNFLRSFQERGSSVASVWSGWVGVSARATWRPSSAAKRRRARCSVSSCPAAASTSIT